MDGTRQRLGSLLEWLLAAACAITGALLLSFGVQNLQSAAGGVAVIAKEAPGPLPIAGIPPGVARVPLLLLSNDREVHIGDSLPAVAERLGSLSALVSESREDLGTGRRVIRFYTDTAVQFIVVFDAAVRDQEPRLSAIFIR
jgi:hypothetical protein